MFQTIQIFVWNSAKIFGHIPDDGNFVLDVRNMTRNFSTIPDIGTIPDNIKGIGGGDGLFFL